MILFVAWLLCLLIAGGLGVFNPMVQCAYEYSASVDITRPLSQCIVSGQSCDYFQMKSAICLSRQSSYSDTSSSFRSHFSHSLQTALYLATIRGASTWLSALPLSEYGFTYIRLPFIML